MLDSYIAHCIAVKLDNYLLQKIYTVVKHNDTIHGNQSLFDSHHCGLFLLHPKVSLSKVHVAVVTVLWT